MPGRSEGAHRPDPRSTDHAGRDILKRKKGPLALVILDGFGHSEQRDGNAIALARMPFYDGLRE